MEVAAADHPAAAGGDRGLVGDPATREDERVVGRRVELDVEDAPQVVERVAHRAVDLRDAAERVRVLHLVVVPVVAGLERAVAEEVPKLGGDGDLARMRPGELVRGGERHIRAQQGLDAHRPDDARGPDQSVRVGQDERPDRTHHLGPVEERQAFLGLERQRLEAGFAQRQHRRHERAADLHLAPADEGQRQVRERREVPGRPDAPLLGDDRMDAQAQEVEEAIDEQGPAAAVTQRERVGPQQEHRPDDLAREGGADPGRMAHQQVLLETTGVGRGDRVEASAPNPVVTP